MIEIGNKKVDMVEVHAFADDLQQITSDVQAQLSKVIKSIETIQGMASFSGKAAKDAKRYFNELHVTVLTAFQGLFEDLEANVQQHINTFEAEVDDSETAIITSHYLQEVREDIEGFFEKLTSEDDTIHDIISEVSDITSAKSPDFSDVNEWQKKAVKAMKELEEDISSFTNTGNETDVQKIMNQIETVMSKAKGNTGEACFEHFEGISSIDALGKLSTYNETNDIKVIQAMIPKMSKSERIKTEILAAENPSMLLTYLNENFHDLLQSFGKNKLVEDFMDSDLYVDLIWTVSPIYNAYNKLVNKLSEKGPLVMEFNVKNLLPRIFLQKVTVPNKEEDRIDEMEAWENSVVNDLEEINEIEQIKAYLLSDEVGKKDIDSIISYFEQKEEEPLTFWDKREVIASNKEVTPDGLAGPATAVFTVAYALTIEDAIVLVDPKTELDERVIAALFMFPVPTKFGKVFLKPADDLGGAGNVGRKGKKDSNLLDTKGTDKALLTNEGKVGTYKQLVKQGTAFDNITPHHMPSAEKMKQVGIKRNDGVSMNMEQPHPGSGGRHRETYTYGLSGEKSKEYLNLSFRNALAHDILDARRIYIKDGLYTAEIRESFREVIKRNKELYPHLFDK